MKGNRKVSHARGENRLLASIPWIVFLLSASGPSKATTWQITHDPAISSDQIGSLVLQAASGDTFLVGPGTYYEHIFAEDKDLTFLSTAGAESTILDGSVPIEGREGSLIYSFEASSGCLTLQGFTLRRGEGSYQQSLAGRGGAIYWNDRLEWLGSLDVRACEFVDNGSGYMGVGGGAAIWASSIEAAKIESCGFRENHWADQFNGVVTMGGMTECSIIGSAFDLAEDGAVALSLFGQHCMIEDCRFEATTWGGECIYSTAISVRIAGSRFVDHGSAPAATYLTFGYAGVPGIEPLQTLELESNLFWSEAGSDSIAEPSIFVFLPNQRVTIRNNTFVHSGIVTDGGGGYRAQISGNIFYRSRAAFFAWYGGDLSCNDIWPGELETGPGYTLTDNIREDPILCDMEGGDFSVAFRSPCAPEHSPDGCGQIGAFGPACEDTPVETMSWGRIKALWRDRK